jgi:predicted nucleotidyltransferase
MPTNTQPFEGNEAASKLSGILPHHAETLLNTIEHFSKDPEVTGLILAGSIAHGFFSPDSDVDVMILVSDEHHQERLRTRRTGFFNRELCTYAGGYVDGKYTSEGFLREVEARGSEPARYAFKDARVLFAANPLLPGRLEHIARYPVEEKAARILRFQAQFMAWLWYTGEALKRQNAYLLRTAVAKLSLFGGRIILAHNELLYPYHKWFLRVLDAAPEKPAGLLGVIEALAAAPTSETIEHFATLIRGFRTWEVGHDAWGPLFGLESELNWLHAPAPVDDI